MARVSLPGAPALLLLLAAALAGCTGDGGASGDQSEGTWFVTKGIQCEPTPWEAWAKSSGHKASGAEADEPFEYDERRANVMAAYYDTRDDGVRDTWAYYDDRVYASMCGAPNAWNYWVLADEAPGDNWVGTDKSPEQAAADGDAGI